nr:MAG TPA: hypothetical protein [Caudoviricetes sp.]
MNNLERQNIDMIANIMKIAYDINKIDGEPIINIALNGQELQMHIYEDNKCYVRITDLNTNPQRTMRELLFLEASLIEDLLLKGGGENLCDQ